MTAILASIKLKLWKFSTFLWQAFEIKTEKTENWKCQGFPFNMGHSRELALRAAALVCTLKDIKGSCRYAIELFSSSLYSKDHDTTHNSTFIYGPNVLLNASTINRRFWLCFFFSCLNCSLLHFTNSLWGISGHYEIWNKNKVVFNKL